MTLTTFEIFTFDMCEYRNYSSPKAHWESHNTISANSLGVFKKDKTSCLTSPNNQANISNKRSSKIVMKTMGTILKPLLIMLRKVKSVSAI